MDYIETHKKIRLLPPLFPLVLYNGDDKWTAATDFKALLQQPDLLKHYAPQLQYFKIAENEYTTENLLNISNLVSTLFLAEKGDDLQLIKTELLNLFDKQEDKQAISILLNWFKQLSLHGKQSHDAYQEVEHIYHSKNEAKTMLETALERYGQGFFIKGVEQGLQKGKKEGIKEGERKGRVNTLCLLLENRFGKLTAQQKNKILLFNEEKLNEYLNKILTAQSLQEFL